MAANDLSDLLLNAERINRFLSDEFKYEPGDDVDMDDSFREAAKDLSEGIIKLNGVMLRGRDIPSEWSKVPPPPPPEPPKVLTREEQIAEVRARAKELGYRLVLHPPTSKKEPA